MARPRKEIDWDIFDNLCEIQCTEREIAKVFGCSEDTIARAVKREKGKSFAEYFEEKRAAGRISLRRAQWQKGVEEGNVTMLIWLGKQYLGQSEHTTIGGDSKSPIVIEDAKEILLRKLGAVLVDIPLTLPDAYVL